MRVLRLSVLSAGIALSFGVTAPASAQGFFESLFGGFSKPTWPQPMSPNRYDGANYSAYGRSYPYWYGEAPRPRQSSRLRAMCVRTCDGYYWPIADRATRQDLYDLSRQCSEACDGAARLYYLPANSTDITNMEDLAGRRYSSLETAFLYRKHYIGSCRCKPQPWTLSERLRHQTYAKVQREELPDQNGKDDRTIIEQLPDGAAGDEAEEELFDVEQAALGGDLSLDAGQDTQPRGEVERAVRPAPTYRHRARVSRARDTSAKWGLFGGSGQQKYVWPGDGSRRRR